jgi:hypothetical protein
LIKLFICFIFSRYTVGGNELLGLDIRWAYDAGIVTVSYSGSFKVGLHSHPDPSFQRQQGTIENTEVAAKLANLSAQSSFPLLTDGAVRAPERTLMTSLTESRLEAHARNNTFLDVQLPKRELLPRMKVRSFKDSFSNGILWITTVS